MSIASYPIWVSILASSLHCLAKPKSHIFMIGGEEESSRVLSSLRSRWATLWLWQYLTADKNCCRHKLFQQLLQEAKLVKVKQAFWSMSRGHDRNYLEEVSSLVLWQEQPHSLCFLPFICNIRGQAATCCTLHNLLDANETKVSPKTEPPNTTWKVVETISPIALEVFAA